MNWFAVMGVSLAVLAVCAVATVGKAFGIWRWAKYQWADAKAWLFDAPEDDDPIEYQAPLDSLDYYCEPEPFKPRPADAPKKRKRKKS